MKLKRKNKTQGQITIFIVLLLNMIFIFFAMVINIGLVIHDKINLQNSVDLGAIYAAQKQAEALNAIAHINYQIRQSYKLLAWRTLVLGSLGANYTFDSSPPSTADGLKDYDIDKSYGRGSGASDAQAHCTRVKETCKFGSDQKGGPCSLTNHIKNINECPYAVCMQNSQFFLKTGFSLNINYCQKADKDGIGSFVVPSQENLTGFPTIGQAIAERAIQNARDQILADCASLTEINWLMASSFLYNFRIAQFLRKNLIKKIYDDVLEPGKDLEGGLITDGVKQTILQNLTFVNVTGANDPNFRLEVRFSSTTKNFNDYFQWKQIEPIPLYVLNAAGSGTAPPSTAAEKVCPRTIQSIRFTPTNPTDICAGTDFENLCNSSSSPPPGRLDPYDARHLSSGFYKEPGNDKVFGVKVTARVPYEKQIFFPFRGTITLRASAYAKPFGGVFGPPEDADDLLPQATAPDPSAPDSDAQIARNNIPNYSRYVGDQVGLFSQAVQYGWHKALVYRNSRRPAHFDQFTECRPLGSVNAAGQGRGCSGQEATGKTFDNYMKLNPSSGLVEHYELNASGGLNIKQDKIFNTDIRVAEYAAIAPDLFDLYYYTIIPNYMTTLYQKLSKNSDLDSYKAANGQSFLPGDLGHIDTLLGDYGGQDITRITPPKCFKDSGDFRGGDFHMNYIEKQIICAKEVLTPNFPSGGPLYKAKSINQVLTAWLPPPSNQMYAHLEMYSPDKYPTTSDKFEFGDCPNDADDRSVKLQPPLLEAGGQVKEQNFIPRHCLIGGRSGFSVKLVSPEVLENSFP